MKIVVLSCANTGNFGDDIILEGIKIKLSREYPNVSGTIHQVLRINDGTIDFVNSCDLLIIGGGEILSHSDVLEQVTKFGIKVPYRFLSVGVGGEDGILPFINKLRPTSWSGRTKRDVEILQKCGIRADLCIDPIFECPVQRGSNSRIGINLKNLHKDNIFINNMAVVFDTLINMGVEFDFLSLNSMPRQELKYCGEKIAVSDCTGNELMQQIQPRMQNKINIVSYKGSNPLEFLNVLAGYEAIVGERLHAVMAAYHAGIPFRAIAYHEKVNKFLETFGLTNVIEHDPVAIGHSVNELWFKRAYV